MSLPAIPSRPRPGVITALAAAGVFLYANSCPAAPATKPAGGENAYTVLCSAVKGLRDEAKIGFAAKQTHDTEKEADDRPYSDDEVAQLVSENQAPLADARRALRLPYSVPLTDVNITTKIPCLIKFRALARLFVLDARVKSASSNPAAAMDSALDAIALGELVQTRTTYVGCLAGVACEAAGGRAAWDIVQHLSTAESAAAAHRLERIISTHPPFSAVMANEHIIARNSIPLFLSARDPVAMVGDTGYQFVGGDSDALRQGVAEMRKAGLSAALADIDAADAKMARLNGGLWKVPDADPPLLGKLVITRFLYSIDVPKMRFTVIAAEAQDRLLLTTLAVHAYEGEHSQLPDNLKQLAPAYYRAVPADVFTAGEPLKYGRSDGKAIIYSIGPDGIDDSGDPINNPGTKTEAARTAPTIDSTGDIVAGINI